MLSLCCVGTARYVAGIRWRQPSSVRKRRARYVGSPSRLMVRGRSVLDVLSFITSLMSLAETGEGRPWRGGLEAGGDRP
jgi:hypothetical protein